MSEGVTWTFRASPTNQLRLIFYQWGSKAHSFVCFFSPHSVAECGFQFIFKEVVRQTRCYCHSKNKEQGKPEFRITVHLKLHTIIVALREKVEDELGVKGEVENEVKQDASPDKKMINPGPVLRKKRDLSGQKEVLIFLPMMWPHNGTSTTPQQVKKRKKKKKT